MVGTLLQPEKTLLQVVGTLLQTNKSETQRDRTETQRDKRETQVVGTLLQVAKRETQLNKTGTQVDKCETRGGLDGSQRGECWFAGGETMSPAHERRSLGRASRVQAGRDRFSTRGTLEVNAQAAFVESG